MPRTIRLNDEGERLELLSPTAMPRAASFLWNRSMLVHVNCRGFVTARHMQPEPSRYSYAPLPEQETFMQPEQPHYGHHPGRFVYLRDDVSGTVSSVPYEPVRRVPDEFVFSVGRSDVEWRVSSNGIGTRLRLSLPVDDAVELWSLEVENCSNTARSISAYPSFTIGYMSWMNQGAGYRDDLGGIVATCVTPYQKLADFEKVLARKDRTFLLHDQPPIAWETCRETFEGEGGPQRPDALLAERLGNGSAQYETPVAVLQYQLTLAPGESRELRFLFGPAHDDDEIRALRQKYFDGNDGYARADTEYRRFLDRGRGCIRIATPDPELDTFINQWLNRQVWYHGTSNRLTTDPQTRNYLQDAMGMSYVDPAMTRDMFVRALGQQREDGRMPDGILLHDKAELKYINQVPHTDHCVWLCVCLQAYLSETANDALLDEVISGRDGKDASVFERMTSAMRSLIANLDERNLSLIAEGDWCDPMNMVGARGRGVSAWLSMATIFALNTWSSICARRNEQALAGEFGQTAQLVSAAVQEHFWHGDWFARGITDDDAVFGTAADAEGAIFLNPQSWSILAGIATPEQREQLLAAAAEYLDTPFGMKILAPPYTQLRADIGRLTQKYPGTAENGSVYNHAAMFFLRALYEAGHGDHAYAQVRKAIPSLHGADTIARGQLPAFVPNYYRGDAGSDAGHAMGRSSQLFNTGAASWLYRCVVEDLFGLRGEAGGLRIAPQLPSAWNNATATRQFRGAELTVQYARDPAVSATRVVVDGEEIPEKLLTHLEAGRRYRVAVMLPVETGA